MEIKVYTLKTRSGLHCGIGQGLSDIDLPTAKDQVSGYPLIPGSSLKGVLRDRFDDGSPIFKAGFGLNSKDANDKDANFASALSFTDARLICLPVRSYFGTFAYLASSYSLNILKEILVQSGTKNLPAFPTYPAPTDTDSYRVSLPEKSKLKSFSRLAEKVLLEDLDLLVDKDSTTLADKWAELIGDMLYPEEEESKKLFIDHFAIVDDNVLSFLCETALPVTAHTKIGENGVVTPGALWYEEFVPPEAIFVGAIYGERGRGDQNKDLSANDLLNFVCAKNIDCQVGGSATTGRGFVSIQFN